MLLSLQLSYYFKTLMLNLILSYDSLDLELQNQMVCVQDSIVQIQSHNKLFILTFSLINYTVVMVTAIIRIGGNPLLGQVNM